MDAAARTLLDQEARALLTRLARVRSFALSETMVPAAAISFEAQTAIERYLEQGRRALRRLVGEYLRWLRGPALLDLVASVRPLLRGLQQGATDQRVAWRCWERWISEIVADLWAVARVGITATHGLIGVVSLPRYFVFRPNLDDPHPAPWIRV